jgi:ornithine decarboxylase
MFSQEPTDVPEGVTAVIAGKAQEFLELETAACRYEENLLPPFFDTLSQYVEMGNSTFACPGHQHGAFFKNTRRDGSSMISSVRMCFAPICAMPM